MTSDVVGANGNGHRSSIVAYSSSEGGRQREQSYRGGAATNGGATSSAAKGMANQEGSAIVAAAAQPRKSSLRPSTAGMARRDTSLIPPSVLGGSATAKDDLFSLQPNTKGAVPAARPATAGPVRSDSLIRFDSPVESPRRTLVASPRESRYFTVKNQEQVYTLSGRRQRPTSAVTAGSRPSASALGWRPSSATPDSFEPRFRPPSARQAVTITGTSAETKRGSIMRPSTAPASSLRRSVSNASDGSSRPASRGGLVNFADGGSRTDVLRPSTGSGVFRRESSMRFEKDRVKPPSLSTVKVTSSSTDMSAQRQSDLCGMGLEEIPEYIFKRLNLTILLLKDNHLTSLPPSLSSLDSLLLLDVEHNRIGRLFDGFCKLSTLQNLNLSDNCLREWPQGFQNLRELRELRVTSNKLRGDILPPDARFPNLQV